VSTSFSRGAQVIINAMVDELSRHGVHTYTIEHKTKHGAIKFMVNGQEKMAVFSLSPSDWRAAMNQRTIIRRAFR